MERLKMVRNFRRFALPTLLTTALAVSALAGCSPDIREVAPISGGDQQSGNEAGAQSGAQSGGAIAAPSTAPALDEAQIQRIVDEVQAVLDDAEVENSTDVLKERLTAGALAMRIGQFERAKKTGTDLPALQIEVNVASATASDEWPRVLLVGSSAKSDDPAEVFILKQDDAKADYMLENWVRALGGNSVRGVAVEAGSVVLPDDAPGFRLTPAETLATYVKHLNRPKKKAYKIFDDKTIAPQHKEEITALNDAVEEAGEVRSHASVGDYPVTAVHLATGEALVAATFTYKTVYDRTVAGSTMTLGGTPAAYLDDPEVLGTATVKYLVNVFFAVPPEGSEEDIRIIGGERTILSVNKDDDATPEGE